MTSTTLRSTKRQYSRDQKAPLVMLSLIWALSLIIVVSPLANTVLIKGIILSIPVTLSMIVTLTRPYLGFTAWSFGLALIVSQTGFQLDWGAIRISLLETVGFFLLLLLLFTRKPSLVHALPGQKYLTLFVVYGAIVFLLTLIQGTPVQLAFIQFKGFLFYPFIAYVFIVGLSSQELITRLAVIIIGLYLLIGVYAISQYGQHISEGDILYRASADYAPQNIFGITLTTVSLFVLGISSHRTTTNGIRWVGYLATLILFLGAMSSLSRTAGVAFIGGVIFLLFTPGLKKNHLLFMFFSAIVLLLIFFSDEVFQLRLLQTVDSSTQKRSFYLVSGLEAWKARWFTGWGWGRAFWSASANPGGSVNWLKILSSGTGELIPTGSIPWYHNDYLNLGVQTGIIGLGLYLAFWQRVLVVGRQWLRQTPDSAMGSYVSGSLAALMGLLIGAVFEHVLWRPDVAGLIGLFLGILIASMHVEKSTPKQ